MGPCTPCVYFLPLLDGSIITTHVVFSQFQVVDPEDHHIELVEGDISPEGQAFVIELYAAHIDWVAAGRPGLTPVVSSVQKDTMVRPRRGRGQH
jgi:hypothetical protein